MNIFTKINEKFLLFLFLILPNSVFAALPVAADVADGADTASPIQGLRDLFTRGSTLIATAVVAVVVIGVGWQMYAAFVKAREKGEWKDFAIVGIVGTFLIVGVVILGVLGAQYGAI